MTTARASQMLIFAGALLLLAACGGEETPLDTSTTSTTLIATPLEPETTMPSVPTENPDTASSAVVEKAILDLSARTKIAEDDITVVVAEAVTWPDGSLGCPQPGVFYTQALVDGSRVLLESGGRLYAYHAGADGEPFLCESSASNGGYDWVPPPGFDT
ncbi:MAG TPA: hypothetical protein VIW94_08125 [Acidimicrobiia bacterium]